MGLGFGRGLLALVFEHVAEVLEQFQGDQVTLGVDFLLLLAEDKRGQEGFEISVWGGRDG